MRAYVITHGWHGAQGTVELVSSKRLAISTCENILKETYPGQKITWTKQEKHNGECEILESGVYTSYKMFFVRSK